MDPYSGFPYNNSNPARRGPSPRRGSSPRPFPSSSSYGSPFLSPPAAPDSPYGARISMSPERNSSAHSQERDERSRSRAMVPAPMEKYKEFQRYTQKFTMDMGAPDNAVIEFSTATGGQSIYYKAVVTNEFYDMLVANHVVEYNSTTGKHTERIERIEGDALISGKSQWVFLDFAPSSENSVTRWIVHPDGDDDDYDEESKTWVYIYREKRIQPRKASARKPRKIPVEGEGDDENRNESLRRLENLSVEPYLTAARTWAPPGSSTRHESFSQNQISSFGALSRQGVHLATSPQWSNLTPAPLIYGRTPTDNSRDYRGRPDTRPRAASSGGSSRSSSGTRTPTQRSPSRPRTLDEAHDYRAPSLIYPLFPPPSSRSTTPTPSRRSTTPTPSRRSTTSTRNGVPPSSSRSTTPLARQHSSQPGDWSSLGKHIRYNSRLSQAFSSSDEDRDCNSDKEEESHNDLEKATA